MTSVIPIVNSFSEGSPPLSANRAKASTQQCAEVQPTDEKVVNVVRESAVNPHAGSGCGSLAGRVDAYSGNDSEISSTTARCNKCSLSALVGLKKDLIGSDFRNDSNAMHALFEKSMLKFDCDTGEPIKDADEHFKTFCDLFSTSKLKADPIFVNHIRKESRGIDGREDYIDKIIGSNDWVGYEGDKNNEGLPHGQGALTYDDGSKYVGAWVDGKQHGEGTCTYANGDIYVGQWVDGKRHGQGALACDDGSKYVGAWVDGKRNGAGTYTFSDKSSYTGNWVDGKMDGKGKFTFKNDSVYEGMWHADKQHGQGTCTSADGAKYEGMWHEGERHGQGTFTSATGGIVGDIITGIYENNHVVLDDEKTKDLEHLDSGSVEHQAVARVLRMLLDDESCMGGFKLVETNQILKALLADCPEFKGSNLLDYTDVNDYMSQSVKSDCTLNVSRGGHAFLLGVEGVLGSSTNYVVLKLYDSSTSQDRHIKTNGSKQGATCISKTIKEKDLSKELEKLNETKDSTELAEVFTKDATIFSGKLQKLQTMGSCSVDCWLTYLKHNLSEAEFHAVRAHLFDKGRTFFETAAKTEISPVKEHLANLVTTAEGKLTRRRNMTMTSLFDKSMERFDPITGKPIKDADVHFKPFCDLFSTSNLKTDPDFLKYIIEESRDVSTREQKINDIIRNDSDAMQALFERGTNRFDPDTGKPIVDADSYFDIFCSLLRDSELKGDPEFVEYIQSALQDTTDFNSRLDAAMGGDACTRSTSTRSG